MESKVIEGKTCIARDVVYSSFGTGNVEPENDIKDVTYSWDDNGNRIEKPLDKDYSEVKDTQYAGELPSRLIMLKRPLHIQLRDLYNDHSRMYKSRGNKLKQEEVDLLLDDYRYELHRIIAKAKDMVIQDGGNVDNILRLTSFNGGLELTRAAKSLTVLFKRVEVAFTTFGYIPRDYQTKMNDALSVLISHFVLDVYGPELERRKTETSAFAKSSSEVR